MTAINGKSASSGAPPDPRRPVAEAVYTAMMDEGDPPFAEVEPEDLADILKLTENYLNAHLNFLSANGFRILPRGPYRSPPASLRPWRCSRPPRRSSTARSARAS